MTFDLTITGATALTITNLQRPELTLYDYKGEFATFS